MSTDTTTASEVLIDAAEAIDERASQRDHPNGERSIARAVAMFNALTGHQVTEPEGWIFQALLKLSRAQGGRVHLDDYVDAAAYIALAAESIQARDGGRIPHGGRGPAFRCTERVGVTQYVGAR